MPKRLTFLERFGVEPDCLIRHRAEYEAVLTPRQMQVAIAWAAQSEARAATIAASLHMTAGNLRRIASQARGRLIGKTKNLRSYRPLAVKLLSDFEPTQEQLDAINKQLPRRARSVLGAAMTHPNLNSAGIARSTGIALSSVSKHTKRIVSVVRGVRASWPRKQRLEESEVEDE